MIYFTQREVDRLKEHNQTVLYVHKLIIVVLVGLLVASLIN